MKKTIAIENAKLIFRNFSGAAGQYNAAGQRNFCVVIDRETADTLVADGWNVKVSKPKDPDDEPICYVQVKVSFDKQPPKIILISSRGKTIQTEDMLSNLDWAEFAHVDLIINPSPWNVSGKTGVKGYLRSMYATVVEDEFESKYLDVPDTGGPGHIGGCGNCEACTGDCGCNGH